MKRLLLILLFVGGFCFGQNDSLVFENPIKINTENLDRDDFKKIRKYTEKFSGKTRYEARNVGLANNIEVYIETIKDVALLKSLFRYDGRDWVFMEKVTIKINDDFYEIPLKNVDKTTYLGGVRESAEIIVDEEVCNKLKLMTDENAEVYIRYEGERYFDKRINRYEKRQFKRVLELWDSFLKSQQ